MVYKRRKRPTTKRRPRRGTRRPVRRAIKRFERKRNPRFLEMRRKKSAIFEVSYTDGPSEQVFKGLNTHNSFNAIINPLNYNWENDASSATLDQFSGKGVLPRYLKQKLLFEFPGNEASIIEPMRIQVIWGFITRPLQLNEYTSPKGSEVSRGQFVDLLTKQLEGFWNYSDDELSFRVKNKTNFKVLGKRWVRPDRRHRIGVPQQQSWHDQAIVGAPPKVAMSIKWPMNRPWRLTKSDDSEDYPQPANPFWYNNQQWVPFVVVYNPDYANVKPDDDPTNPVPEAHRVQLKHCSCIWYTDG